MAEAKYERITFRALELVRAGSRPDDAWLKTLEEVYPANMLSSQVKHSCPKWAFCILCHGGHVKRVNPGCCPESENSSSASYTISALNKLIADPSLAANKKELKRMVFGQKGQAGYRQPNDEAEVLLSLHGAGEI